MEDIQSCWGGCCCDLVKSLTPLGLTIMAIENRIGSITKHPTAHHLTSVHPEIGNTDLYETPATVKYSEIGSISH